MVAARLYPDWPQYASRIAEAIRGLTPEQLDLRMGPDHAPAWALAAHMAGVRVYWLCGVFGEPGAETTPFVDPHGDGWEDDETHPRTGDELVLALESTWQVVMGCLERWTADSLDRSAERVRSGRVQVHTRASVLNRLFSHDAFHAGEISQLLGAHGAGDIDLWRPEDPGR